LKEKTMSNDSQESIEKVYEGRFAWRKARQLYNFREISDFAQSGGGAALQAFPALRGSLSSDDPKDALRWSILMLWCEAAECYIFGEFQSCILTCGSVVERSLKLEYETKHGPLPTNAIWTLGTCIKKCTGIVEPEVLEFAHQILEPRNSRAHALLEHSDPQLAIIGGDEGGVEILSSGHALIEPYRGDAKKVIELTFKILRSLYGKQ
jgi:hypothetical protein